MKLSLLSSFVRLQMRAFSSCHRNVLFPTYLLSSRINFSTNKRSAELPSYLSHSRYSFHDKHDPQKKDTQQAIDEEESSCTCCLPSYLQNNRYLYPDQQTSVEPSEERMKTVQMMSQETRRAEQSSSWLSKQISTEEKFRLLDTTQNKQEETITRVSFMTVSSSPSTHTTSSDNQDLPNFTESWQLQLKRDLEQIRCSAADFPSSFICPLTGEVYVDPVIASDQRVYERAVIEEYMEKHNHSPMDKKIILSKYLFPHTELLKEMERYCEQNSHLISPEWRGNPYTSAKKTVAKHMERPIESVGNTYLE